MPVGARGSGGLTVVRACDLEATPPDENWLIRDVWGRSAVGIVGGQPKCCKSWFSLDMAVSIASNTPCLDHFEVDHPGPTLVYLAEDPPSQQRARLDALCDHRGLAIAKLDLHVITVPVLRLDLEADRADLHATLERYKPRLLVLDPLVRLHRLDENSAMEISGLLSFLRELQRTHDVAIAVVHHASKKQRSRPGQALRGSSDIHAFADDLAHLTRPNDRDLILTLEHRSAPSPAPMKIRLASRADKLATHLELVDAALPPRAEGPPDQRVLAILAGSGHACTRQELRDRMKINNKRLGDVLTSLEKGGTIRRSADGWSLPPPPPPSTTTQPSLF